MNELNTELRPLFDVMVDAFNGVKIRAGTLQSGTSKNIAPPRLVWGVGSWVSEPWETNKKRFIWDLPCDLSATVEASAESAILDVIYDIEQFAGLVNGMPVAQRRDGSYYAVPFGHDLWNSAAKRKKILYPWERFDGPHITRVVAAPNQSEGGIAVAGLTWRVEFVLNTEIASERVVRVMTLGMQSRNVVPTPEQVDTRTNIPFAQRVPIMASAADTESQGGYVEPQLTVNIGGKDVTLPVDPDVTLPLDPGPDPSTLLRYVQPTPASKTLAAMATQQLEGIAVYADGGTQNVSTTATWETSNGAVATVSSSGLVTAVASGTATIAATWMGVSGTAAITVS